MKGTTKIIIILLLIANLMVFTYAAMVGKLIGALIIALYITILFGGLFGSIYYICTRKIRR